MKSDLKPLLLVLAVLLGAFFLARNYWPLPPTPGPDPGPEPDDLTVLGDGILRAPRPLFGDCNSNGVIDLLEVQHKPLGLSGPETFDVGEDPTVHVRGDFNGDNAIDLVIAYRDLATVLVLYNDGNGSFPVADRVSLAIDSQARNIAAGDFNNDGLLDLAVARVGAMADEITVFHNDPAVPGTFPTSQDYVIGDAAHIWTIEDLVAVDLDGSLGTDLVVLSNRASIMGGRSDLLVLAAAADGSLAATSYPELWLSDAASIIAEDLDQDGDPDLAIGGNDWVILARNDGTGSLTVPLDGGVASGDFTDSTSDYYGLGYSLAGGRYLAAADLDRDGYPELISLDSGEDRLLLLPNTSTVEALRFDSRDDSIRVYSSPGARSISVNDMDGDGLPDIVIGGPALEQVSILLSQGDLVFEPTAYTFDAGMIISRVLAAELDGVNPPELTALSTENDSLIVFTNASRISTDCNSNGIPDVCDVESLTSRDCNQNRVPDECDVAYQVGLSSRAVWQHYAYNSDRDVEQFERVEGSVPLLGWHFYDPVLWTAQLDNDQDNELIVMNAWTAEYQRFLFNTDYGNFVVVQNPAELRGASSTRLRNFLALDLGIGFWDEKAVAMASGEFTGDSLDDLAVVTLESAMADGREVTVTALKIIEQGRSDLLATWATRGVIYEQSNPRLPPMRQVIAADFDLDGDQDLAVTPDVISSDLPHDPDLELEFKIVLLRNDGTGDFHHNPERDIPLDGAATSIIAKDLNGDDRPDIVVSSHSYPRVTVCHNRESGTDGFDFTGGCRDFAAGSIPLAAKAGDLDGDNFPEIVVANGYTNHVSILHNSPVPGIDPSADRWRENFDAPETLSVRGTAPAAAPTDLALVDLDLDGDLDIVTANSSSDSVTVLRNAGEGTFLEPMVFAAGLRPEAMRIDDLNRDERSDIAVANGDGTVTILLNRSRTPRSEDEPGDGRPDECVVD